MRLRLVKGETRGSRRCATARRRTFSAARPRCRRACGCWTPSSSARAAAGWAQLALAEPVAVAPGDRFIIRQPSPSLTLGGGTWRIRTRARRWRRFQPDVIAQLETLARGTPEDLVLHALDTQEPAPLKAVAEASGLDAATAEPVLAEMIAGGQVIPLGTAQPPLTRSLTPAISAGGWRTLSARMAETLADYHAQYPLRPGMAREELKSRVQGRDKWSPKLFNELVALRRRRGCAG